MSNRLGIIVLMTTIFLTGCNTPGQPAQTREDWKNDLAILKMDVQALRLEVWQLRQEQKPATSAAGMAANPENRPASNGRKTANVPDMAVYDVAIGSSPVLGPAAAPITIVEFADFQCPYCEREKNRLKEVMAKYPGMIRLVFKNLPLKMHPQAQPAHAAAIFAYQEGGLEGFWKMHDLIFANQKKLAVSDLRGYAQSLQLDLAKFDKIMADPNQVMPILRLDGQEAKKCNIRGTPTILINGLKLADRTPEGYQARIEAILGAPDNEKKQN